MLYDVPIWLWFVFAAYLFCWLCYGLWLVQYGVPCVMCTCVDQSNWREAETLLGHLSFVIRASYKIMAYLPLIP